MLGVFLCEVLYSLLFNHFQLADKPAIFCDLDEVQTGGKF
jgi:hypothetical protein